MTSNTRQGHGGRMQLSKFPISGKVLSFNAQKGFGWIRPTQQVSNLPGSHLNGGRVFVHIRDLVGLEKLEKDQEVRFLLYSDDKGLGASNCTLNEIPEGEEPPPEEELVPPDNMMHQEQAFDEPRVVISIHVENMFIGGIIGKKGATIKELSSSTGAKIDIVSEDMEDPSQKRDPQRYRLVNLTGTSTQLKAVTKKIAKTLSEISQSLYSKVTFLIHQSQAGRLIGKKGANIKKIRGDKPKVNLTISKEPVLINEQPLITVTIFGPCNDVEASIDETVNQLSEIYQIMLQQHQQQQMHEGGYDQGYGGYDQGGYHQNQGWGGHQNYNQNFY